jgi:hypothetical protein
MKKPGLMLLVLGMFFLPVFSFLVILYIFHLRQVGSIVADRDEGDDAT